MAALDLSALRFEELIAREWLATSGNGAYASSTLIGLNSRKYHGLLVAAMTPPVRRMVLLSRVEETIHLADGVSADLASNEYPGTVFPQGHRYLRAFSHEPFPRWGYQGDGWTIEKQLRPLKGENTVVISYSLLGGDAPVEIELRPLFALRGIHELMFQWNGKLDARNVGEERRHHRIPATTRTPEVFFAHDGAFGQQPSWYLNTIYRREQERGYAGLEDLWMPGVIRWKLQPGQTAHFVCSTEPIDLTRAVTTTYRQYDTSTVHPIIQKPDSTLEALLRAAEQFVVRASDGVPGIMFGYPWSAVGGRDAMIALPGLLLASGRIDEARELLEHFVSLLRDGLMPSEMTEDGSGYRYTAADTSLWFIHAVGEFLRYRGDETVVRRVFLPAIVQIISSYIHGTKLGIGIDDDGLLFSRAPGTPTTWMNAKVGDWVITPRAGRPVSLNALWYNALRTAAFLSVRFNQQEHADELLALAAKVREAFNRRFWNPDARCCFDVVEDHGNDPSVRPNQLLALSLPYPVLDPSLHSAVLERVQRDLLTPVGLRTVARTDPAYQAHYAGEPVTRERALHQGSAFPWLLGPLVTASVKLKGRGEAARNEAREFLQGALAYLQDRGLGQICELFDGDSPHIPGGAPASARSVAELLRCYAEDVLDLAPALPPPAPAPEPVHPHVEPAAEATGDPVNHST